MLFHILIQYAVSSAHTMSFTRSLLVLVLVTWMGSNVKGQCCQFCKCFDVDTINVTAAELSGESPQYTQAVSGDDDDGVDSICRRRQSTNVPETDLAHLTVTFTNMSTSGQASTIKMIEPGVFQGGGPTRLYRNYYLAEPCSGTFVLYNCDLTDDCVSSKRKAAVSIVAREPRLANEDCIERGIAEAQKVFRGLKFRRLPRTTPDPCKPTSETTDVSKGSKGGSFLKVLLSVQFS